MQAESIKFSAEFELVVGWLVCLALPSGASSQMSCTAF